MLEKYPDYRIVCVDKLTYAGNLSTLAPVMDNPNFRFCKIDICDREAIYQLFEEEHPDMVVNFAAESHVDRSIENPEVFLDTNIKGTAVMMDACRKYGIQRYHQVSTDEVYGDLPLDRPDLFFTDNLYDVNILHFIMSADIVHFSDTSFMNNKVDGTAMILNI